MQGGWRHNVLSPRKLSLFAKNRDDHVKPITGARFEVSYQQFKSQVPQPVRKKEEFGCQRKQREADINLLVNVLCE